MHINWTYIYMTDANVQKSAGSPPEAFALSLSLNQKKRQQTGRALNQRMLLSWKKKILHVTKSMVPSD